MQNDIRSQAPYRWANGTLTIPPGIRTRNLLISAVVSRSGRIKVYNHIILAMKSKSSNNHSIHTVYYSSDLNFILLLHDYFKYLYLIYQDVELLFILGTNMCTLVQYTHCSVCSVYLCKPRKRAYHKF